MCNRFGILCGPDDDDVDDDNEDIRSISFSKRDLVPSAVDDSPEESLRDMKRIKVKFHLLFLLCVFSILLFLVSRCCRDDDYPNKQRIQQMPSPKVQSKLLYCNRK